MNRQQRRARAKVHQKRNRLAERLKPVKLIPYKIKLRTPRGRPEGKVPLEDWIVAQQAQRRTRRQREEESLLALRLRENERERTGMYGPLPVDQFPDPTSTNHCARCPGGSFVQCGRHGEWFRNHQGMQPHSTGGDRIATCGQHAELAARKPQEDTRDYWDLPEYQTPRSQPPGWNPSYGRFVN